MAVCFCARAESSAVRPSVLATLTSAPSSTASFTVSRISASRSAAIDRHPRGAAPHAQRGHHRRRPLLPALIALALHVVRLVNHFRYRRRVSRAGA